jgi:hypothetical protein
MIDSLLISPDFFGYPQAIVKALERRCRRAIWINDRPGTDTWTKAVVRVSPRLMQRKSDAYFEGEISRVADEAIRDVVVIKGEALSLDMIARMRKMLPNARFTLYFWDSFLNMPKGSVHKIPLFDRAFSFDPVDAAAEPGLVYRPLFYIPDVAAVESAPAPIDVLFVGTAHSDRVKVLRRVAQSIPESFAFRKVLYVRSQLLHSVQSIVSRDYRLMDHKDFIFSPMPGSEVRALVEQSRVVLDIERHVQTGYTMRSIEMLGASKKLITTNASIKDADFYNPNNQHVIDRENPRVDPAFIDKAWVPCDDTVLQRYSLDGWIDDIFE